MVDEKGKIVHEAKVLSEPEALVQFFSELGLALTQIGLEAGPLSQWLHAGMVKAGLPVVLLETRHVKAALSAMIVKTDRKDARGIAQLLRMGWYRSVHCKSLPSQAASPVGARDAARPVGRAQTPPDEALGHRVQHPWSVAGLNAGLP